MNAYTVVAVVNVSVIALVGLGIYITESLWMLVGLLFMMRTTHQDNEEE